MAVPITQPGPILEFCHPSGAAITWGELDPAFLQEAGIGPSAWDRPIRVELEARRSTRGNTFFDYAHGAFPLPDGLDTVLHLNDVTLLAEAVRTSQKGNPTRRHYTTLTLAGMLYEAIAYVTKSKSPYWVKVHVQRLARQRPPDNRPQGGKFV